MKNRSPWISARTASLQPDPKTPSEIDVRGFVGDVSMSFSGEIQRQQGSGKAILLDTHISGSRLDKMSRVLNYDFPPIGHIASMAPCT
ncbi:MAG: hypothetical protein JKP90_21525 [Desulfofustis sp. PB-SRB1]|nr:hypothetical protein [Desulfofustis sp. PB-SRB1]